MTAISPTTGQMAGQTAWRSTVDTGSPTRRQACRKNDQCSRDDDRYERPDGHSGQPQGPDEQDAERSSPPRSSHSSPPATVLAGALEDHVRAGEADAHQHHRQQQLGDDDAVLERRPDPCRTDRACA